MVQDADRGRDETSDGKKRVRPVVVPETKQKEIVLIVVKSIEQQGKSVLVEWFYDDMVRRCIIPRTKMDGSGSVDLDVLKAGVSYGVKWSVLDSVSAALEQELYRQGIWEKSDMVKLSHKARGAVERILCVPVVSELLEFAKTKEV